MRDGEPPQDPRQRITQTRGGLTPRLPPRAARRRIIDEHGDEWELMVHPSKVVGANDFTATVRRVDDPTETRPLRWKAHERVKVRRA